MSFSTDVAGLLLILVFTVVHHLDYFAYFLLFVAWCRSALAVLYQNSYVLNLILPRVTWHICAGLRSIIYEHFRNLQYKFNNTTDSILESKVPGFHSPGWKWEHAIQLFQTYQYFDSLILENRCFPGKQQSSRQLRKGRTIWKHASLLGNRRWRDKCVDFLKLITRWTDSRKDYKMLEKDCDKRITPRTSVKKLYQEAVNI